MAIELDQFTLKSSAFEADQPIPQVYTGEGDNLSPPLEWNTPPDRTQAFAILCEDPDAPRETPFVHWLLFNIPGEARSLPEGAKEQVNMMDPFHGTFGLNSWENRKYEGPLPPVGHGVHHYHFKLYALSSTLKLSDKPTKEEFLKAIEDKILAECELVGTYERKSGAGYSRQIA